MKTDDPEEFDSYEAYMKEDTNEIKVIIYASKDSPRNDQFAFSLKAKTKEEALDLGLDGFASKGYTQSDIRDMVAKRQKQMEDNAELELLRIKVKDQEIKLKDNQEVLDTMQKVIDKAKENGNKIGGIHAGDVLAHAIEMVLKRNAPAIAKATGFEGLAGAFGGDNTTSQQQENYESSFRRKENSTDSPLTEHEKEFIVLFHQLEKCFNAEEMLEIIDILNLLSKDKTQLTPVLELLQDSQPE